MGFVVVFHAESTDHRQPIDPEQKRCSRIPVYHPVLDLLHGCDQEWIGRRRDINHLIVARDGSGVVVWLVDHHEGLFAERLGRPGLGQPRDDFHGWLFCSMQIEDGDTLSVTEPYQLRATAHRTNKVERPW